MSHVKADPEMMARDGITGRKVKGTNLINSFKHLKKSEFKLLLDEYMNMDEVY